MLSGLMRLYMQTLKHKGKSQGNRNYHYFEKSVLSVPSKVKLLDLITWSVQAIL